MNWLLAYNPTGPSVEFIAPTALTLVTALSQVKDVTYPSGGSGAITAGYVLTWSGAGWAPAAPTGGSGGGGSSTLAGDSDVDIMTPSDGQVLTYHAGSTKWINAAPSAGATALSALTDVNVTEAGLTNGYLLGWNSSTSKWVATAPPSGGSGGGSSTLAGDSDVAISSPTNGQVLTYNSSASKWENVASGGSSSWTQLTWGTTETLFGISVKPSAQTFTLAAGDHLEIKGYLHRGSTDAAVIVSPDGLTGMAVLCQVSDGSYHIQRYWNGGNNSEAAFGNSVAWQSYAGFYYVEFHLVPFAGSESELMWAVVNSNSTGFKADTESQTSWIGAVTLYLETDTPANCNLVARVINASTIATLPVGEIGI